MAPACRGKSKKPSQQSGQPSKGGRQRKPKPQREQWIAEENPGSSADELPIYTLRDSSRPLHAEVKLNEKSVHMEVDTGAAVSLISQSKLRALFPDLPIMKSNVDDIYWGTYGCTRRD